MAITVKDQARQGYYRASDEERLVAAETNKVLDEWFAYYIERLPPVILQPKRESLDEYKARVLSMGLKSPWAPEEKKSVRKLPRRTEEEPPRSRSVVYLRSLGRQEDSELRPEVRRTLPPEGGDFSGD